MKTPTRVAWLGPNDDGVWLGEVFGAEDAFDHVVLHAGPDGFHAAIGSFTFEGDATNPDEAKRAAQLALVAMIEVNNQLSTEAPAAPLDRLSDRERMILRALQRGKRPAAIAAELGISKHTVRNHLKGIYRKLEIGSQVELLALAAGGHDG